MTSRIHAPHTRCPGCLEEVYLDELVGGRCPLCGFSVDELCEGEDLEDFLGRSDLSFIVFQYFLFTKLDRLGANPMQIMEVLARFEEVYSRESRVDEEAKFEIDLPMHIMDHLRPKRCNTCGKLFFRGGIKRICGDITNPGFSVLYLCRACRQ